MSLEWDQEGWDYSSSLEDSDSMSEEEDISESGGDELESSEQYSDYDSYSSYSEDPIAKPVRERNLVKKTGLNNQRIKKLSEYQGESTIYSKNNFDATPSRGKIDNLVSSFLDNKFYGGEISLPFTKLSAADGIYMFGARKIRIAANSKDNLAVKIGNNYTLLDAFWNKYEKIEKLKLVGHASGLNSMITAMNMGLC